MQDQHFMIDKDLLKKIVETTHLKKDDVVLEIGAGKGYLTKLLVKKCRVIAVEMDEELYTDLKKNLSSDNLTLIHGNALEEISKHKFNKIVSNLPYSISEPLFKKLFKLNFELAVVVIGKNFYEIITSENRLGHCCKLFFTITMMTEIPKDAFYPRPKVDSVAIVIKKNHKESIMRQLVLQNDKKIKNALDKIFEGRMTKKELKNKAEVLGNDLLNKMFWQLSEEEFKSIKSWLDSSI